MVETPITPVNRNPLTAFMRQPKIFVKLPSEGKFWPPGSLEISETGEYPVYSMTAKDELQLKIPDALMNGQAVVDVIQNCMPNIKNAWLTPSIDMDFILIAIRLATYGELMKTPVKFNEDIEMDYQMDLRIVMDQLLNNVTWNSAVSIDSNMTVFVRPLNYRQMTQGAIKTFETQKILQLVNNEKVSEEEKVKLFRESFNKLNDATVGTIAASIERIDTISGSTDNPEFIREFIENTDKVTFNKIFNHLEALREQNKLKPVKVPVTDEMREQGIIDEFVEIPLEFDPATFFV